MSHLAKCTFLGLPKTQVCSRTPHFQRVDSQIKPISAGTDPECPAPFSQPLDHHLAEGGCYLSLKDGASDPHSFRVVVALVVESFLSVCPDSADRTAARSLFEVLLAVRQLFLEQCLPSVHLKVCLMLDELLILSD